MMPPNEITPVNPALASRLHSLPFVGRVTEFRRSAIDYDGKIQIDRCVAGIRR